MRKTPIPLKPARFSQERGQHEPWFERGAHPLGDRVPRRFPVCLQEAKNDKISTNLLCREKNYAIIDLLIVSG